MKHLTKALKLRYEKDKEGYFSNLLKDVEEGKQFIFHNGKEAHNLLEFLEVLRKADQSLVNEHVTDNRNDFYNWIKDVIGDEELAEAIRNVRMRADIIYLIEKRIEWYKKVDKKLKRLGNKKDKIEKAIERIEKAEQEILNEEKKIEQKENNLSKIGKEIKRIEEIKAKRLHTLYSIITIILLILIAIVLIILTN